MKSQDKDDKTCSKVKRQRLDVPSVSPLEQRLRVGIDARGTRPGTVPVAPSDMLDRVKAFLPSLQQANAQLAQKEPGSFDIEHVEEGAPHIKMDLACGVVELKDKNAEAAAARAMCSGAAVDLCAPPLDDSTSSASDSQDDSDSDNDGDDESDEAGMREASAADATSPGLRCEESCGKEARQYRNIAGKKARQKAGIVQLGSQTGNGAIVHKLDEQQ